MSSPNHEVINLWQKNRVELKLKVSKVRFKRVLKRNATLILVNMTVGERFGSRIYDRVYSLSPKTMGGCRGIRLVQKLKQSGFTVKQREYYQQLLFPSEVILAHK